MLVAAVLAILLSTCEAQKGGAKNAMRNRGKSSGGGGGSRVGGGNRGVEVAEGGRYTGPGADSSKPRPCEGLCFLRYFSYYC